MNKIVNIKIALHIKKIQSQNELTLKTDFHINNLRSAIHICYLQS
jgi:hypothetical protein